MSDQQQPPEPGDAAPTPPPTPPPAGPPSYPSYPSYPADGDGPAFAEEPGAQVPSGPQPYRVGEAFGIGFRLFGKHAPAFLLMMLLIVASALVFGGIGYALSDHQTVTSDNSFDLSAEFSAPQIVLQVIGNIISTLLTAALIKGALDAVDGRTVSVGGMFTGWDKLQVLLAAIVVNVLVAIGLVLLIIPGLIVLFLTWFASYVIVDTGKTVFEAISASASFASAHVGPLLLTGLLAFVANIVGACLCLVGLFVSVPVTIVMAAVAFRQLQGRGVVTA